jgi:hypothetical protein
MVDVSWKYRLPRYLKARADAKKKQRLLVLRSEEVAETSRAGVSSA